MRHYAEAKTSDGECLVLTDDPGGTRYLYAIWSQARQSHVRREMTISAADRWIASAKARSLIARNEDTCGPPAGWWRFR